jgi:hypothetical protein
MPEFDIRTATDDQLWEVLRTAGVNPGSERANYARAELDRRARKVMEDRARKASWVATVSAIASVFSAAAAAISAAIAYFHQH